MSSLFAGLKEKLVDKLAEFRSSPAADDPNELKAAKVVDEATSDILIAPDWGANLNVVDFVNSNVCLNSGLILKAIKRCLDKPSIKAQLLSLTLLESCVKNCPPEFHIQLATSELWTDVVKLVEDTSINRVDSEVRNTVIGMVENFARFLQPFQFRVAYESLLRRGVEFPVRTPDDSVPFLTPPASVTTTAAAAMSVTEAAGGMAVATPGLEGLAVANSADPLAGLDEQDRVAIQAALAEFEEEAQVAQVAARVAAEMDAEERRQLHQRQREQQQAQLQFQQQQQEAVEAKAALGLWAAAQTAEAVVPAQAATTTATAVAAAPAMQSVAVAATVTAGGGASVAGTGPHAATGDQVLFQADSGVTHVHRPEALGGGAAQEEDEQEMVKERVATLLETANNTTLLLSEMLASVPDSEPLAVREPYVAELAETCVRLKSRLERHLQALTDEELLASALSQHEELSRVLIRYDELLAAAAVLVPILPRNADLVTISHAAASRSHLVVPGTYDVQQAPQADHDMQGSGAAGAALPAGQKVAAVAASLKERFTDAFDKLMGRRALGPQSLNSSGGVQPASTGLTAAGLGGSGAGIPTVATAGGAFTLLDDEDDEAGEGTSLMTRRAPQVQIHPQPKTSLRYPDDVAVVAPLSQQHLPLQKLLHQAASAAPLPPPLPPPQPPASEPDLINFDGDGLPQLANAGVVSLQSLQPTSVPSAPNWETAVNSAAGGHTSANDLLLGLTLHPVMTDTASMSDSCAPPRPPPDAASITSHLVTPPPLLSLPTVSVGGCSDDHLVQRLDLIMSQISTNPSPEEGSSQTQSLAR